MSLYLIKSFKSFGGRSDSGQFSNGYHVSTGAGIDDAEWPAIINNIVAQEKNLTHNQTNFMRVLVTPFAENVLNAPERVMRTFEQQGIGNRAIPAGSHALDLNVCLIIKRQLATGRSGRFFLRGALHEGDVQMGADGRFVLTPESSFYANVSTSSIDQLWNLGANFSHVIPNPAGLVVQLSRAVTAFKLGGVTLNRRDHRKKSKTMDNVGIAQAALNAIGEQIDNLLGGASPATLAGVALIAYNALRTRGLSLVALLPALVRSKVIIPAVLQ